MLVVGGVGKVTCSAGSCRVPLVLGAPLKTMMKVEDACGGAGAVCSYI